MYWRQPDERLGSPAPKGKVPRGVVVPPKSELCRFMPSESLVTVLPLMVYPIQTELDGDVKPSHDLIKSYSLVSLGSSSVAGGSSDRQLACAVA